MRETQIWSLGWEDPLEKEMKTHSSTLAWKIPWTEEPGGLQCMGSQRVQHDWANSVFFFMNPGGISGKEPTCQCRRCRRRVLSLDQEYPLEKEMATHSSILAWKIPWTEEPGGLRSMGSQRVGHDWANLHSQFHAAHLLGNCETGGWAEVRGRGPQGSEVVRFWLHSSLWMYNEVCRILPH